MTAQWAARRHQELSAERGSGVEPHAEGRRFLLRVEDDAGEGCGREMLCEPREVVEVAPPTGRKKKLS